MSEQEVTQQLRSVDEKLSHNLDQHKELYVQERWDDIRSRLGKLHAGATSMQADRENYRIALLTAK